MPSSKGVRGDPIHIQNTGTLEEAILYYIIYFLANKIKSLLTFIHVLFILKVSESVRYVQNCLQLVILMKMSTNPW